MSEQFLVRVAKDEATFCAAHFITFNGETCERLHGHNYRLGVELRGPLDENHYVVDFIALRDAIKRLTAELDHRVLLPTEHRAIAVTADPLNVEARFRERRWSFPREDCVLLPLANTTAELLAQYLGQRLLEALASACGFHPAWLRIEIDECPGQVGIWEYTRD